MSACVKGVVSLHAAAQCGRVRRLYYAGGNVLLADVTCKAVLRYARALAESRRYDVVSLPVIGDGGERGNAHLLLGPASSLFSTPVVHGGDELEDIDLVRRLEHRTRGLHPDRPDWSEEMADIPDYESDYR
jgi:hypothetical protein